MTLINAVVIIALAGASCSKPAETESNRSSIKHRSFGETSLISKLEATSAELIDCPMPGCDEFNRKCGGGSGGGGSPDPAQVAKALQDGSRKLIDTLAKISPTDKAILKCGSTATGEIIKCANGGCPVTDFTSAYNTGAKAACAINSCLQGFFPGNVAMQAMALTCDAGNKLAKTIECYGFPGIGGGLKELCETEKKNCQPIVLQPCPLNPSVGSCTPSGAPRTEDDIYGECLSVMNNAKQQGNMNDLQFGPCIRKCIDNTLGSGQQCPCRTSHCR